MYTRIQVCPQVHFYKNLFCKRRILNYKYILYIFLTNLFFFKYSIKLYIKVLRKNKFVKMSVGISEGGFAFLSFQIATKPMMTVQRPRNPYAVAVRRRRRRLRNRRATRPARHPDDSFPASSAVTCRTAAGVTCSPGRNVKSTAARR